MWSITKTTDMRNTNTAKFTEKWSNMNTIELFYLPLLEFDRTANEKLVVFSRTRINKNCCIKLLQLISNQIRIILITPMGTCITRCGQTITKCPDWNSYSSFLFSNFAYFAVANWPLPLPRPPRPRPPRPLPRAGEGTGTVSSSESIAMSSNAGRSRSPEVSPRSSRWSLALAIAWVRDRTYNCSYRNSCDNVNISAT